MVVTRNGKGLLLPNRRRLPSVEMALRRLNRSRQKPEAWSRRRPHHRRRKRSLSMSRLDPATSGFVAGGSGAANGFGCQADGWFLQGPESSGFAGIGADNMAAGLGYRLTGAINGSNMT